MRGFEFSTAAEWKVEDAVVGLSKFGTVRMLVAAGFGKVSTAVAPPEFQSAMAELNVVTDEELAQIEAASTADEE